MLADLGERFQDAVQAFCDARARQQQKQIEASAGAGSYVNEWDCQGQTTQEWSVESSYIPADPGAVEIINVAKGMCLDVRGAFPFNATPIDIWPCVGSANQKWTLEYLGFTLETA